jgi:segregation and condensation protein B
MDDNKLKSAIEAILFASGDPVPGERISLVLAVPEEDVFSAAAELAEEYESGGRGIRLLRLENRLQLCSAPEFAQAVVKVMERRKPPRLSDSALEALAITAYFQPVTRAYIDQVRGVDSSYTVSVLLDRGLIEKCGRLEAPGRPTLYRTTDVFLRTMGISELSQLPELPDCSSSEGLEKLQMAIDAYSNADDGQLTIDEVADPSAGE